MAIYHISPLASQLISIKENLNEKNLLEFPTIVDLGQFEVETKIHNQDLVNLKVQDIITYFDSLSQTWSTGITSFNSKFGYLGISFLIHFLKKKNINNLLKVSLKGNLDFLNQFVKHEKLDKYLMAHPKGIILHWLSGNVPVLGMLSLVQGILTKNVNIIKLPLENGAILPKMVAEIMKHRVAIDGGKELSGETIFKGVRFVYCPRDDKTSQENLSRIADVRVAWGGKDAVEAVIRNPKKYSTKDVVFGPKYSFVVIAKNSISKEEIDDIAYKIALDASIFEQKGCNSPHTVFIEESGNISGIEFAKSLSKGMEKVLKRIPKAPLTPQESLKIINTRSEYEFIGEVFASKGTEWSVLYSADEGLADACFNRVLFVRPIKSLDQVLKYIDHNSQTIGLCISENERFSFAKKATAAGVERITDLGKMSVYDHPWDGEFPMESFVRWVSLC